MQILKINEWTKSSFSTAANNCVEAKYDGEKIHVRNSKSPEAGTATFTPDEWKAFLSGIREGEFSVNA